MFSNVSKRFKLVDKLAVGYIVTRVKCVDLIDVVSPAPSSNHDAVKGLLNVVVMVLIFSLLITQTVLNLISTFLEKSKT